MGVPWVEQPVSPVARIEALVMKPRWLECTPNRAAIRVSTSYDDRSAAVPQSPKWVPEAQDLEMRMPLPCHKPLHSSCHMHGPAKVRSASAGSHRTTMAKKQPWTTDQGCREPARPKSRRGKALAWSLDAQLFCFLFPPAGRCHASGRCILMGRSTRHDSGTQLDLQYG